MIVFSYRWSCLGAALLSFGGLGTDSGGGTGGGVCWADDLEDDDEEEDEDDEDEEEDGDFSGNAGGGSDVVRDECRGLITTGGGTGHGDEARCSMSYLASVLAKVIKYTFS